MCLILLAYQFHPRYPLIVAANRDEFYDRPSAAAAPWDDEPGVLAGRDLQHGGTWLGVTRDGRFAAVTNLRRGIPELPDAPSRGHLVGRFLLQRDPPERYLAGVRKEAASYNGFNLVVGDRSGLYCYSNSTDTVLRIPRGIAGFSNHPPEAPWPKTVRGKALLARAVATGPLSEDRLLAVLSDGTPPCDPPLANDEESGEERKCTPIFIKGRGFGTRCSTVLLFGEDGTLTFVERTFCGEAEPTTVRLHVPLSL